MLTYILTMQTNDDSFNRKKFIIVLIMYITNIYKKNKSKRVNLSSIKIAKSTDCVLERICKHNLSVTKHKINESFYSVTKHKINESFYDHNQ